MPSRIQDLVTRLLVKDDASKVIENVADELEALEKQGDTAITIDAEDKASPEIKSLSQLLEGLSKEDQQIVLTAKAADAERDINRILRSLKDVQKMDQETIDLRVNALGDARAELDGIQAELRDLDGETAEVHVDAPGLDGLTDQLGSLPGIFGEIGEAASSLGSGGPIVAGVTAIAAGLVAAADAAADMALEAQTMSQLTGDSTEDASRLQAIWRTTGADVNDLNDVLLQMNGVLAQTPQLAGQLGVNLQDGATIGQRFAEVVRKLGNFTGTASEKAQLMSQVFGEEGVRQVAKLTSLVGDDLAPAMAEIADGQVISPEEVDQALDMKRAVQEINAQFQALSVELGQSIIPLMTDLVNLAEQVKLPAILETGVGKLTQFTDSLDDARASFHALVTEDVHGTIADNLQNAADAAADLAARNVEIADTQQHAAQDQEAAFGIALSRITSYADVQREVLDNQLEMGKAIAQMIKGVAAYDKAVKSVDWKNADLEGAITGMEEFRDAHFGLAEIAQNSAEAEKALGESVKENGKNFDLATRAGLKNLDAIRGVAEQVDTKLAAAYEKANGNQRKFQNSAEEIADTTLARLAEQMGLSKEQTAELAEALGLMPEDIETRYELSGAEEAQLKLDLLSTSIDDLPDDVKTTVTQEILKGDYQGALDEIQDYYDDNPATLPVIPVWQRDTSPGSGPGAPIPTSTGFTATATAPVGMASLPPIVVNVRVPKQQPQITLNAGVMGDTWDLMRAVDQTVRRANRLLPVMP